MDMHMIARNVVQIPRLMQKDTHLSIASALELTGYNQNYSSIETTQLAEALAADKTLLDEWKQYSEDKRTTSGWYIEFTQNDFIVGYFESSRGSTQKLHFTNPVDACAAFVKREIENIRTSEK